MKPMMCAASARWTGGASEGSGAMSTESGALKHTRYKSGAAVKKSAGTHPAELIAAAHAGSFSMALAHELGAAGFVANHIATVATVTLDWLAVGWTMSSIHLKVLARVPNAAQGDFIDATLRAKTGCPVSRLLRANISMNAKLEIDAPEGAPPRLSKENKNPPARKNRSPGRTSERPE